MCVCVCVDWMSVVSLVWMETNIVKGDLYIHYPHHHEMVVSEASHYAEKLKQYIVHEYFWS